MPVRGTKEINGEDVKITFDTEGNPVIPAKEYDLGYGYLGTPPPIENNPDPAINITDMNNFGYEGEDMFSLTEAWALYYYQIIQSVKSNFDE